MNQNKIAQLISLFLGPIFLWPITLFVFLFKSVLTLQQLILFFPLLILFQVVIPLIYIYFAFRRGSVSDLDLTDRKERIKPLIIIFLCLLISLGLIAYFGNSLLLKLNIILLAVLVVNAFITLYWKISLHMALNVTATILINYLFGWKLPYLYIAIPLVYWSRLTLKKHSVSQLVAGFVLNVSILLLFFYGGWL